MNDSVNVILMSSNRTRMVQYDTTHLSHFVGNVCGSPKSSVTALMDEEAGNVFAKINVDNNLFIIEPLSSYAEYKDNNSLLIYSLRDIMPIKMDYSCSVKHTHLTKIKSFDTRKRITRESAVNEKTLCRLTFIADYSFFKYVGDHNGPKTIRIIIALFHQLNAMYQAAKFLVDEGVEKSGYGFLLGDIIIHDSWTPIPGHYNARFDVGGKDWSPQALSTAFNYATFNHTCLAHLLTYRPFMGVLGRAWMAAPELGGICSPPGIQDGREFHTNTGWTTYLDHSGRRLLNSMAELITAHELGHNWGAAHDPDTPECSPPALSRGKYLMYAHSVGGFAENNYKFSPCSRRTVGATLAARAPLCFVSAAESLKTRCGNRRVDPGEECDAGGVDGDTCCTPDCKFRSTAMCSPWNHDCCTKDCNVAAANSSCTGRQSSNPCLTPSKCDGVSPTCPRSVPMSGVPCEEHGQCVQGKCLTHCALHGLKTCLCDEPEQSCYICCLFSEANRTNAFTCRPALQPIPNQSSVSIDGRYSLVQAASPGSEQQQQLMVLHLDDYRPCVTGYCKQGRCVKSKQNSILRFWGFYHEQEENVTFKSFLRDNLVIVVVTVSLLIWIPTTLGLRALEKRKERILTMPNVHPQK